MAAEAFTALCRAEGTEPQFIPYPATWLNGERWLDEDDQPPATAEDRAARERQIIEEACQPFAGADESPEEA